MLRRLILCALALLVPASVHAQERPAATPPSPTAPSPSGSLTYGFGLDYMLQVSGRRDYPFHDATFADDESFAWWRIRPRFTARSKHMDVVIEGQDTHSAGGSFGVRKAWLDLLNAYVDVKEMRGWAVKVGRQQGDLEVLTRMVRTPDFAAVVRSFDVAEVSWQKSGLDLRGMVFKPVDNQPSRFNTPRKGELLWTAYAKRTWSPRTSIQSYVVARHNDEALSETGVAGDGAVYAWEVQATGPTPAARVNWTVETVLERGHAATDAVRAWGVFTRTDIDLGRGHLLDVRYLVTSGDRETGDGVRGQYDTFYAAASNFGGLGQLRGINVRTFSIGGTLVINRPLWLNLRYFNSHLHEARDGWYGAVVPNMRVADATSTFLGHETSATLFYRVTPKLQVRAAYHRFYPGGYVPTAQGAPHEFRLQIIGGL